MSGVVAEPVGDVVVDPSCRHAAMARLLRQIDPGVDPRLVLGNDVGTGVVPVGERLAVEDIDPALGPVLQARGYRVHRHEVRVAEDLRAAWSTLAAGRPIVIWADTFHLPYHWLDRGRVHSLHAVVLQDLDPAGATVRLVDGVGATFFDGPVPWTGIEAAMPPRRGSAWFDVRAPADRPRLGPAELYAEWGARLDQLDGRTADGAIGGAGLAAYFRDRLADYLDAPEPEGPPAVVPRTRAAVNVFWTYHHVLRWFSGYLDALIAGVAAGAADAAAGLASTAAADLTSTSVAAADAAQDWLIARNLFMRAVGSGPDRRDRFATETRSRLGAAVAHLDQVRDGLARSRDRL